MIETKPHIYFNIVSSLFVDFLTTQNGETAFDVAQKKGNAEIALLLSVRVASHHGFFRIQHINDISFMSASMHIFVLRWTGRDGRLQAVREARCN